MSSGVRLRRPTDRICERCGRREAWSDESESWRVVVDDADGPQAGSVHCIHEWDINGNFLPIEG
ncbi:HEWD family protein [Haloprofundus halobius]|uniref:HEWD family protein n=1 Tax=Haloprofundus halobius TaxID=2876194 RepID=UPI001CCC9055|nr:HEWD family protein [Haloprofundus halobius]